MNPNEKARELFISISHDSFVGASLNSSQVKHIVIIHLNNMISELESVENIYELDMKGTIAYWMKVKGEVIKL